MIVLQRHTDARFIDWIPRWKSEGKKVIYDLDDNVWDIPGYNLNRKYYPSTQKRIIESIISLCDAAICSTNKLAKVVGKFNSNVYIAPNMLEEFPNKPVENTSNRLRIGWGGSLSHAGDFPSKLTHVIKHCQKKYDAQFVWVGYRLTDIPGDILIPPSPMPDYLDVLHNAQLDIAVAPLENNFFNDCKSNLKFLEYSASYIPTIASNSTEYGDTISQGITGFVIKHKEWDEYLEYLCENDDARKVIGNNARTFVEQNYNWEVNSNKHISIYQNILEV